MKSSASHSVRPAAAGETLSADRRASLTGMAEEIFSLSTSGWQVRQRSKPQGPADLSETEYLALDLLAHRGTLTVGQIQRHVGVLPAQMSRIIRSLESNHSRPLIACTINARDKRKVDVALTEAGRAAHRQFRDARLAVTVEVLSHVSDRELADLMRGLRAVREQMDAMIEASQP